MKPGSVGKHRRQDGPARIYMIEADAATQDFPPSETASPPEDNTADGQRDRLVFTVEEAAYLLNISRALAYDLVARGDIPSIRLGRRIVLPRQQLQLLLDG